MPLPSVSSPQLDPARLAASIEAALHRERAAARAKGDGHWALELREELRNTLATTFNLSREDADLEITAEVADMLNDGIPDYETALAGLVAAQRAFIAMGDVGALKRALLASQGPRGSHDGSEAHHG